MSSEKLKKAIENIAFCADDTWNQQQSLYQQANLNHYLTALRIEKSTAPRTVRDSIPESKLAKYGNYEYNEARELSYAPVSNDYENLYSKTDDQAATEPWMLKAVDDLFKAYVGLDDKKTQKTDSASKKDDKHIFYPQFTKKTDK